ncbi:Uma2 family endonuclease [Symbioplanes lichenis]|uniref:Uma2 family endonuclease n=1 Tax=Symbioplanes lichenis TaxID=1629072 RepID=UPI00273A043B|nr:Uma2 family endonuclease [Actinoplanes lichenis]
MTGLAYAWAPDPVRQRDSSYFLDDVLLLPDSAPRVELRHGVASPLPRPNAGHQQTAALLWLFFRHNAPEGFTAVTRIGLAAGLRDTFEPDVMVLQVPVGKDNHFVRPEQVQIAVEVVSPGTEERDRLRKPADYASVGIPHFWLVEQQPLQVLAHDLVDGGYVQVAKAELEDVLMLSAPFEMRLPVRDIAP